MWVSRTGRNMGECEGAMGESFGSITQSPVLQLGFVFWNSHQVCLFER